MNGSYRNSTRGCVPNSFGSEQGPVAGASQLSGLHATRGITDEMNNHQFLKDSPVLKTRKRYRLPSTETRCGTD